MLQRRLFTSSRCPLTRDGRRRLRLCVLLETGAASVQPDLALAFCKNRGIVALQIPHVCPAACFYAHRARCHLCPPSNNIFPLSAVPRRLQGTEIRGRRNYRWGGGSEALFTAKLIES